MAQAHGKDSTRACKVKCAIQWLCMSRAFANLAHALVASIFVHSAILRSARVFNAVLAAECVSDSAAAIMDGPAFSFPFEPYDIQLQFMQALYRCIDDGNIGIFESPTGQPA